MGLVVEYFVTDRAMSEWHGYAKVFSGKEKKKRKTKTVGVSMKPRNYVKKLDEFISGNKRLNCCVKSIK